MLVARPSAAAAARSRVEESVLGCDAFVHAAFARAAAGATAGGPGHHAPRRGRGVRRGRVSVGLRSEGKRRSASSSAALEHGEEPGARVGGGTRVRGCTGVRWRAGLMLEPEESPVGRSGIIVRDLGGGFSAEGWLRGPARREHAHGPGATPAHVEHAADLQRALQQQLVEHRPAVARAQLEHELALAQIERHALVAHHALGAVDPGEQHRGRPTGHDADVDLEQLRTLGRVRHEPVRGVSHRAMRGRRRRSCLPPTQTLDRLSKVVEKRSQK